MPRPSKSSVVTHKPAPPPAVVRHQAPSLFQTMQEGLAFGVGSSVARNMIDRVLQPSAPVPRTICTDEHAAFDKCVMTHDDVRYCIDAHETFKKCIASRA